MVSFRELLPDNTDCNTYAHERINFQNTTRMAARLTTGGTLADLEYMGLLDRLVVVVCRDTGSTGIPTGIASASAAMLPMVEAHTRRQWRNKTVLYNPPTAHRIGLFEGLLPVGGGAFVDGGGHSCSMEF